MKYRFDSLVYFVSAKLTNRDTIDAYHFLRWSPRPDQEIGILKLDQTKIIEARVNCGVVVVVGLNEPIVNSGKTREVNLGAFQLQFNIFVAHS